MGSGGFCDWPQCLAVIDRGWGLNECRDCGGFYCPEHSVYGPEDGGGRLMCLTCLEKATSS